MTACDTLSTVTPIISTLTDLNTTRKKWYNYSYTIIRNYTSHYKNVCEYWCKGRKFNC